MLIQAVLLHLGCISEEPFPVRSGTTASAGLVCCSFPEGKRGVILAAGRFRLTTGEITVPAEPHLCRVAGTKHP